jgi:purine-binding chemotaxis protein CheW
VTLPAAATDALLFELAGSRYAVPAMHVAEVVRAVQIEMLPRAPWVVSGLINLRGEIVPVIDVRRRLGLPDKELAPEDYFVIAHCGARRVALHVDRALELESIRPEPVPRVGEETQADYVAGVVPVADGVLMIHDLPAFLSAAESEMLDDALGQAASPHEGAA